MNIVRMHKTLRNLISNANMRKTDYFCPSCEYRLEYSYLEEGLYYIKCKECKKIKSLVNAKNMYEAARIAGGLETRPCHINLEDGKALCTNCTSDLMGCFDDPEISIIQCPRCGARISDWVESEVV